MKGVFVVGAGPAGMFAARQIALAGYETYIFNRDIRPGGLAQYGIYPLKTKMKSGLRKQFEQTLALPNVHYFGHVQIGAAYDLSLAELEAMRPAAIVFACGAQGAGKARASRRRCEGDLRCQGLRLLLQPARSLCFRRLRDWESASPLSA